MSLEYEILKMKKEDIKKNNLEDNLTVFSWFYKKKKFVWHYSKKIEHTTAQCINNECKFTLSQNRDFIKNCVLMFTTPKITVKEDFKNIIRIKFTKNYGSNLIKNAEFLTGENVLSSWDNYWFDAYVQWFTSKEKFDITKKKLGNIPNLTEWCDELCPVKLFVHHPWFFSLVDHAAFPLCFTKELFYMKYKFRTATELLIAEQFVDNDWIKVLPETILDKIIVENSDQVSMCIEYFDLFPKQKEWMKCKEIFSCDIYKIKTIEKKIQKSDTEVTVPLDISENTLAMFIMITNNEKEHFNYRSEYLKREGNINAFSLKFGEQSYFSKIPSDFFSINLSSEFPHDPKEEGYYAHSFVINSTTYYEEPKTDLKSLNSTLNIYLDSELDTEDVVSTNLETLTKSYKQLQKKINLGSHKTVKIILLQKTELKINTNTGKYI